jgi:hypothetical protein
LFVAELLLFVQRVPKTILDPPLAILADLPRPGQKLFLDPLPIIFRWITKSHPNGILVGVNSASLG